MPRIVLLLTVLAALGSALMAGSFFAFSTFVMKGLSRLAPADGIRAVQAINVAVAPSPFIAVFLLTTLVSLALAVMAFTGDATTPMRALLISGALLYVVGTFGVTMVFNVPRNDLIAALDPTSPDAPATWARYLVEWTAWNHVRTVASLLATVAFAARALAALPAGLLR